MRKIYLLLVLSMIFVAAAGFEKPSLASDIHMGDCRIVAGQAPNQLAQKEITPQNFETAEEEKVEGTLAEYWEQPWRYTDVSVKFLKQRSKKILVFILICLIYLKRSYFISFLRRKGPGTN